MVSSRLFEMLAEAGAKPSGAYTDAMSALGAATKGVEAYNDFREGRQKNRTLGEIFGPENLNKAGVGTLAGTRLRDVDPTVLSLTKEIVGSKKSPIVIRGEEGYYLQDPQTGERIFMNWGEAGGPIRPPSTPQPTLPERSAQTLFVEEVKGLKESGKKLGANDMKVLRDKTRSLGVNESILAGLEMNPQEETFESDMAEARKRIVQGGMSRDQSDSILRDMQRAYPERAMEIRIKLDQVRRSIPK